MLAGLATGLLGALLVGSPALADPPGPTDYQSEIVAVDPPTGTIQTSIVGGDSFFQLTVEPGTEVVVVGYQGEDTLWFRPDGTVWENRNSPSTYLNEDRLGGGGIPANASADAEPDWRQVASDGNFSWHDHRAHWMQQARPFGLGPGDQILESVIPLVVDGVEVEVTVISTWQQAASPVPMVLGFVMGAAAALGAFLLRRVHRSPLVVLAPVAVLALVVGLWQFRSLPPETDPRLIWWVLPAIAVVSAAIGLVVERRVGRFAGDAALLIVGVELAIWGFAKRDGFSAAIIPTDAPGWLDRFTTALALAAGAGTVVVALWFLFAVPQRAAAEMPDAGVSGSTAATDSPPPVHP